MEQSTKYDVIAMVLSAQDFISSIKEEGYATARFMIWILVLGHDLCFICDHVLIKDRDLGYGEMWKPDPNLKSP